MQNVHSNANNLKFNQIIFIDIEISFNSEFELTGDEEIVKILIESGAKVDVKDDNDQTPLHLAAQEGQFYFDKKVEKSRYSIDLFYVPGRPNVVKLLIEHGADVRARDSDGQTALETVEHVNADHILVINMLMKAENQNA